MLLRTLSPALVALLLVGSQHTIASPHYEPGAHPPSPEAIALLPTLLYCYTATLFRSSLGESFTETNVADSPPLVRQIRLYNHTSFFPILFTPPTCTFSIPANEKPAVADLFTDWYGHLDPVLNWCREYMKKRPAHVVGPEPPLPAPPPEYGPRTGRAMAQYIKECTLPEGVTHNHPDLWPRLKKDFEPMEKLFDLKKSYYHPGDAIKLKAEKAKSVLFFTENQYIAPQQPVQKGQVILPKLLGKVAAIGTNIKISNGVPEPWETNIEFIQVGRYKLTLWYIFAFLLVLSAIFVIPRLLLLHCAKRPLPSAPPQPSVELQNPFATPPLTPVPSVVHPPQPVARTPPVPKYYVICRLALLSAWLAVDGYLLIGALWMGKWPADYVFTKIDAVAMVGAVAVFQAVGVFLWVEREQREVRRYWVGGCTAWILAACLVVGFGMGAVLRGF